MVALDLRVDFMKKWISGRQIGKTQSVMTRNQSFGDCCESDFGEILYRCLLVETTWYLDMLCNSVYTIVCIELFYFIRPHGLYVRKPNSLSF
jgi:hypothetical protein